jgi:hypothetical protein
LRQKSAQFIDDSFFLKWKVVPHCSAEFLEDREEIGGMVVG